MFPSPLRAIVVDNSATVRTMLAAGLRARSVEVVALGEHGADAVELCERLRPDVLSLDLVMPRSDGLSALEELRARGVPVPVVVVSSIAPSGSDLALRLLEAGAVEVLAKPAPGGPVEGFLDDYARTLRVAAQARVEALWRKPRSSGTPQRRSRLPAGKRRLVVIASSTGGPRALHLVIPRLPRDLGCGTLVVQHMPQQFTGSLARRLDQGGELRVREASDGDQVRGDQVLVAPGGCHLRLVDRLQVATTAEPAIGGLRPRADVTILDAVEHYDDRVVLVVLTGMGRDGLVGARAVRAAGGVIIVESRETALIEGMPMSIADAGLADEVLPIHDIADAVCRTAG